MKTNAICYGKEYPYNKFSNSYTLVCNTCILIMENSKNYLDTDSLDQTLKSIYPYFKQILNPDESEIDKSQVVELSPISKHICEDLTCFYAIDLPEGYEIIQENMLAELKLSKEELHLLAIENLTSSIVGNLKFHSYIDGFMVTFNGAFEASILLIDEFWNDMEQQLGEEILVLVPARDVLLICGKSNTEFIEWYSEKARETLEKGDHPLSKNCFVWKNHKWELFERLYK